MHVISSVMAHIHILNYKWREISHLLNEMNGINQFQFELKFKEMRDRAKKKTNIGCHYIAKARACAWLRSGWMPERCLLIYHSVNFWSNQFQVVLPHCMEMRKTFEYFVFAIYLALNFHVKRFSHTDTTIYTSDCLLCYGFIQIALSNSHFASNGKHWWCKWVICLFAC